MDIRLRLLNDKHWNGAGTESVADISLADCVAICRLKVSRQVRHAANLANFHHPPDLGAFKLLEGGAVSKGVRIESPEFEYDPWQI